VLRSGRHRVTCVDIDEAKVAMLCRGEVPIYEPELEKLIADGRRRKRLYLVSDSAAAVTGADIVFIAVGTPTRASDGHADLSQVYAALPLSVLESRRGRRDEINRSGRYAIKVVNSARVRTNFFPAARNVRHQAWGPMAALYRLPISLSAS
jgi:hypothetical protein